jgi:hypothetical protein
MGGTDNTDAVLVGINTVVLYFLALLYTVAFLMCVVKVSPYLLRPKIKKKQPKRTAQAGGQRNVMKKIEHDLKQNRLEEVLVPPEQQNILGEIAALRSMSS